MAPDKEGALGQMSKNFQIYFILINYLRNQIKMFYNWTEELYCDATIFVFWFFIVDLPKKMESEKFYLSWVFHWDVLEVSV